MIVYRYMSEGEFISYSNGNTISAREISPFWKIFDEMNFLKEETKVISFKGNEFIMHPEECICFLTGIVTEEYLCKFEIDDALMHMRTAPYADYNWEGDENYDWEDDRLCTVEEYTTPFYNLQNATLLSYKKLR